MIYALLAAVGGCASTEHGPTLSPDFTALDVVERQANTTTPDRQQDACVDIDPTGNVLVAWASRRQESGTFGVYAQLFDPAGDRLGGEVHLNQHTPSQQRSPVVSFDAFGQAWVVWESFGQDGEGGAIVARRFRIVDDRLVPVSGETGVNEGQAGHQGSPAVATNDAGLAFITWTSALDRGAGPASRLAGPGGRRVVMGRVFSRDGAAVTGEFSLSGSSSGDESVATVAGLADGGFVAVWAQTNEAGTAGGVFARRFRSNGLPVCAPFSVSDPGGPLEIEPSVDADSSGRFVVAWMSARKGPGYAVSARQFAPDGSALGEAMTVAEARGGWKSGVAVAVAPDGRFVVTYNVAGRRDPEALTPRPPTPCSIMAQMFDARGQRIGPPLIVNRFDEGSQGLAIAGSARRAAWSRYDQIAFAWQGHTPAGDHRGVGLTLLVPDSTRAAGFGPCEGSGRPTPADREHSGKLKHAAQAVGAMAEADGVRDPGRAVTQPGLGDVRRRPPVFDPDFVPEPPDAATGGPGPDFGFLAVQSTGWRPPDPNIGVGPNHLVVVVNGRIKFFEKDGTETFSQDISGPGGFWGEVGATSFVFDPVAVWDVHSERFIAVTAEHADNDGGMFINLAVSDDADPNGQWHKYRFDITSLTGFVDYPNLGVDRQAVYVTDAVSGAILVIPKEPVLEGAPVSFTSVFGSGVLAAVKTFDADAPAQYFATAYSGSNTIVQLEAITDPLGTPVRHTYRLTVPRFLQPPDAEQMGTTNRADTVDFRIKHGVYRNGSLWLSHNVGEGNTAQVRWYEIDMRGWPTSSLEPVLLQTGRVDLGEGVHTWFADIAVDAQGNMAMGFNRSSATEFISVNRTFRRFFYPVGFVREPLIMQVSTTPELQDRWGDYSGIGEDPAEPGTFWIHAEYRTSGWRTWAGRFTIPLDDGDFDSDGDVDMLDFTRFQSCFSGTDGEYEEGCEPGDIDGDGAIGLRDYGPFQRILAGPL